MAAVLEHRRGVTAAVVALTPASGELVLNTEDLTLRVGDATQVGGWTVGGGPTVSVTTTSHAVVPADQGHILICSNAAATAITLPQATIANNFGNGQGLWVLVEGAGTVTITPATSTINGAASLVLVTGSGARIFSNGTNYFAIIGSSLQGTVGQIPGTATNDNAGAGNVGEYISSNIVSGSAVTLTLSITGYNITSISLTAGDWDVNGAIHFNAPGTSSTGSDAGISLVSATLPTLSDTISGSNGPYSNINTPGGTALPQTVVTGTGRLSIASTTTVYLVAYSIYTGTAPTAYGFIRARRVR